jgi:hypothetical protein
MAEHQYFANHAPATERGERVIINITGLALPSLFAASHPQIHIEEQHDLQPPPFS